LQFENGNNLKSTEPKFDFMDSFARYGRSLRIQRGKFSISKVICQIMGTKAQNGGF
jgi:hypothetical protein